MENVAENNQHAIDIGLKQFYKRKIGQYTIDDKLVKEFNSIADAMNETGIKTKNNQACIIWKAKNSRWIYLEIFG